MVTFAEIGYAEDGDLQIGAETIATHTPMPNKTDAGNGSYGISRVIDASRSPSPDPRRSANLDTSPHVPT